MPHVEERSLTPGTLFDGARMYAASADAVVNSYPNALHVQAHLLGMSIELALKSYLRAKGYGVKELRKLSHRILDLYNKCVEEGLYHTGSRRFVVATVSGLFEKRIFAYPQECIMEIILPKRMREIAAEFITEIAPLIHPALELTLPGIEIRAEYPEELSPSAWADPTPGIKDEFA